MDKVPEVITVEELQMHVAGCAVLIVGCGFEDRASRVLEMLHGSRVRRLVLIRYKEGVRQNDEQYQRMADEAREKCQIESIETVSLDLRRPDEFASVLGQALGKWRPDAEGEVWVDISALTMQAICSALFAVRNRLPDSLSECSTQKQESITPLSEKSLDQ